MTWISDFWKSLIEKLTINNPALYRIAAFALSVIAAVLGFGQEFGMWLETPFVAKVGGIVSFLLALLIQDGDAQKKIVAARK